MLELEKYFLIKKKKENKSGEKDFQIVEENLQRRRRRWGEEKVKEKGKESKGEGRMGGKE